MAASLSFSSACRRATSGIEASVGSLSVLGGGLPPHGVHQYGISKRKACVRVTTCDGDREGHLDGRIKRSRFKSRITLTVIETIRMYS
jgi:hypothetical protein